MGKMSYITKKVAQPYRDSTTTVTKRFAVWPKQMESGLYIWFSWYYSVETLINVDPRHKWYHVSDYSEREYFLRKLKDEVFNK